MAACADVSVIGSLRPCATSTHASPGFSAESIARAASFVPRPSDVYVATPPKTGTTWLQHVLHVLRVGCALKGAPGWQEQAMAYDDLYEVSPWDQMAWDLDIDLDAESKWTPRVFKTHLRLAHLCPGGKYICTVRDPVATLLSWYSFLKDKDVPPLRHYWADGGGGVSAFARNPKYFVEDMRFGASLWEMYGEYAACLRDPNVLVVAYEDLVEDFEGQLRLIADFVGLTPSENVIKGVVAMSTKEFMARPEHASKFDESVTYKRLVEVGRAADTTSFRVPTMRVNVHAHKEKPDADCIAFLHAKWTEHLGEKFPSYDALRDAVRAEHKRRMQPSYTKAKV